MEKENDIKEDFYLLNGVYTSDLHKVGQKTKKKGTNQIMQALSKWSKLAQKRREDPEFAKQERIAHSVSLGITEFADG